MNTEKIRQLIKNLGLALECPRCGKKYNLDEIYLRSYSGTTYHLKLLCNACQTPVLATIAISGDLRKIAERLEDLKPKNKLIDISKKKPEKITNDDIIDIHQFLKYFDGDFEKEFKI